jgi:hypothetical protein
MRIRTIKPEFWTSEQVTSCSVTARLLFIGMWNFADDGGRLPASVKRLKMEVFPGDPFGESDMTGWVLELMEAGLIRGYVAGGNPFLEITGWAKHQRIDKPTFRYPAPNTPGALDEQSTPETNGDETETNGDETERNGAERNGAESNGRETKVSTSGRTDGRTDVLDVGVVGKETLRAAQKLGNLQLKQIRSFPNWKDFMTQENDAWMVKHFAACVAVCSALLPARWLDNALDEMTEGKRKIKPHAWLGKVLATTAKEKYGVDFDQFRRALTKHLKALKETDDPKKK